MQAAKKAVEAFKETAANIGASAKSGLEKTKATLQEKTETMNARDQSQVDMATRKKEETINQAEMEKKRAIEYNAAVAGQMTQDHNTTTGPGTETATHDTTGPTTETATNNTTGPGPDNVTYSNTGPGTETATYTSSGTEPDNTIPTSIGNGPGPGAETATYTTNGPGHDNAIPTSTGPGTETATYTTSRPTSTEIETATNPTGQYGQMGADQTAAIPGHGHGIGPSDGGVTGVDMTAAQNTHGSGSAPASGPGPEPSTFT